MMATVNKTPSMDITADDVDLLPWIGATKTMLNLGQLTNMLNAVRDERKQKEAQRRADMEQRRRRR